MESTRLERDVQQYLVLLYRVRSLSDTQDGTETSVFFSPDNWRRLSESSENKRFFAPS